MDDEDIAELFNDCKFPYLKEFKIRSSKITRLEKALFDRFPMLRSFELCSNNEIERIDKDSFSNLKNLEKITICHNKNISESNTKLALPNFANIFWN